MPSAAVAGLGVAMLPCILGDAETRLRRIGKPFGVREMRLVAHRDAMCQDLQPALEGKTR